MTTVHSVAVAGFGQGTNDLYDRARPSYPAGALTAIRASLSGDPPYNILELGAGTGIFTRALLSHPNWENDIKELKAIEPSPGMRETFVKTVNDGRVTINDGTFDNVHVNDHWADAIIVAQAWHWCPDHEKAITEFARVLKPDGVAIFIWNLEDSERAVWVKRVRAVYEAYEKGTPQFRLGLWRQTFSTPAYLANFEKPEELPFTQDIHTTLKGVQERALSKSYIAILDDSEKAKLMREVDNILVNEDKVWIDENQGIFAYPYTTLVVVMRRKK